MFTGIQEDLRKRARDFDVVKNAADKFAQWANDKLQDQEDCDLEVQATLPPKKIRKKKTMPGESSEDETKWCNCGLHDEYIHNVIFDTPAGSIHPSSFF